MAHTRREFLASTAAAGGAAAVAGVAPTLAAAGGVERKLVVVQVDGGWDYLSLLVPADHPVYQRERPQLAIPRGNTLPVAANFDWYWHPALSAFKDLLDRGDLAVVQNVGYPNPNLSHFESIKKWQAGDPTVGTLRSGWLGRYVNTYMGWFHIPAIDIEFTPNPVFASARVPTILNPGALALGFDWSSAEDSGVGRVAIETNALIAQMWGSTAVTRTVGDRYRQAIEDSAVLNAAGRNYTPRANYPATELSEQLKVAARFISGGLPTRAYVARISGFDTHSLQSLRGSPHVGVLAERLQPASGAIKAFLDDMSSWGRAQEVVVMVVSEFGRRVTENGSLGTDHGHGGVAFFAGEPVQAGLYGNTPDLNAIQRPGESFYIPFDNRSTDFRSLLATSLERVLGVPSAPILGGSFPILGVLWMRANWIVAAALAGVATAQELVVPPANAAVEGNALDREPFGLEGVRHITYAHSRLLTSIPQWTNLTSVSYRRDTSLTSAVMRRPSGIWQVRMGNHAGSVSNPPSAWPEINDPAWTLVFAPQFINFPDLWMPASGPASFDLRFWFNRPFNYAGGHIGIEHFVADGITRHDYFIDSIDGLLPGGQVVSMPGGTGCPDGSNRAYGQAPNPGGGDLELYMHGARAGAPAAAFLSASSTAWRGMPLPLDLTIVGNPGCTVMCSPDFILPAPVTQGGTAEVHLPVPGAPELLGKTSWAQWWILDDSVNPGVPFTPSGGLEITLGRHLNSGDVGMSVVSAFSGSNQWGFVQPNRGPVFRLHW